MNSIKKVIVVLFVIFFGLAILPGCNPKKESTPSLKNFSQEITTSAKLSDLKAGEKVTIPVTVKNTGNETWPAKGEKPVGLSYHWLDSERKELAEDGRAYLTKDLAPGESTLLNLEIIGFPKPGEYIIQLCMVQETVAWFVWKGGKPLEMKISIK